MKKKKTPATCARDVKYLGGMFRPSFKTTSIVSWCCRGAVAPPPLAPMLAMGLLLPITSTNLLGVTLPEIPEENL